MKDLASFKWLLCGVIVVAVLGTMLRTADVEARLAPIALSNPATSQIDAPVQTPTAIVADFYNYSAAIFVSGEATPPPPPIDPAEVTCIYALNWWRNPNPPHEIIRSSYIPSCLNAIAVDVTHIIDDIGRQTGYEADVVRSAGEDFFMVATYRFNDGGGVDGADVIKTYASGNVYQISIERFCPTVGQLVGYEALYNNVLYDVGSCN